MSAQALMIAEDLAIVPTRPVGRPTTFTPELGREICEAVARGGSIYALCEANPNWPWEASIYRWAEKNPEFGESLRQARACKAHRYVEEIVAIADGSGEDIRRDELKIKARQWVAPMLAREAYGQAGPAVQVNTQVNLAPFADSAVAKLEQITDRTAPKCDLAAT